jgi:wyosine [tRNA(Phe)-imidazoG37] synthetase (radical SAM superfamily)
MSLPAPATKIYRRIQDIEVIDITGSGNNTLQLNLDDLLHASKNIGIFIAEVINGVF